MGWTGVHLDEPIKPWFIRSINKEAYEVLDVAVVERQRIFAAVKNIKTGEVFCMVSLLIWYKNAYHNLYYKDMDETVCPHAFDCPERIFKLLTPVNSEHDVDGYSAKWREAVKDFHKKRKALKGNVIIRVKDTGIRFNNGETIEYFAKRGRFTYAGEMLGGAFKSKFRIRNIKFTKYEHEVIGEFK